MDDADIAIRNDLFFNRIAMRQARARIAAENETESASECAECGEPIPEARRIAQPGCTLCVACKTKSERR